MDSEDISQSEFDLVDFLREIFPHVLFGMPRLGCDEANWKLTYVALYGLNEIAQCFGDRVELEIIVYDDRVQYEVHTRVERLRELYREIISIVEDGDIEDIIEKRVFPNLNSGASINHNQNFEAIDMLLEFDANDPGRLPDELLDAEDIILFGSASDKMIDDANEYLYEMTMYNGLNSGEVIRPRHGIEISKLTSV
ncbi:hypothetical protein [Sulfitobacter sp. R18_1]|uniref:hypothetical protein n=1 Tax=Sulfitobacter sp. R18_1 TaxID=2821104 RepID=UPI001ADD1555|nr:hypothetical protein [Sulfitobacter sp. R18_1]MBO9428336.1 hypothetical protein [Sulfitobacter sp. R18_1]